MSGVVVDNVYMPIAGARVEVLDGPRAGLFAVTDASGKYALPGGFSDTTIVRASKERYTSATRTFPPQLPWPVERVDVSFFLDTPSIDIAGDYTLTITAGAACPEFPAAVQTRTYDATLTASTAGPNNYQVVLGGAMFYPFANRMFASVAGDVVRVAIDPYDSIVTEQLGQAAFTFWGSVTAPFHGSEISGPFDGALTYCERSLGPIGSFPYVSCAVPPTTCTSASRIVMTRR